MIFHDLRWYHHCDRAYSVMAYQVRCPSSNCSLNLLASSRWAAGCDDATVLRFFSPERCPKSNSAEPGYQRNFSDICTSRGSCAVAVIWPNDAVPKVAPGNWNCDLLKAL